MFGALIQQVQAKPVVGLIPGESIYGLRMSISTAEKDEAGFPKFQVTFRNTGGEDAVLNLGEIGGSEPHINLNFSLIVSDAFGKTRKFEFKGPMYVAGRLEPYLVYVKARSTYSLEVNMGQFWSPETYEYELKLTPGKYQVALEFVGRSPRRSVPAGKSSVKNIWLGQLTSNTLAIER